jgi:hypothetical protein
LQAFLAIFLRKKEKSLIFFIKEPKGDSEIIDI